MNQLYQQMNHPVDSNNMVQRFQQFRQQFAGNPRDQVQQLLNSGRVSQQQYDNAVRIANQFKGMFGL